MQNGRNCEYGQSLPEWSTIHVLHSRVGRALPTNIKLGWEGLPGTNTLVYYKNLLITAVKSFVVQAPELTNGKKKIIKL
jgi:hypothetical protein